MNGKQGHGNTSQAVAMALRRLRKDAPACRLVVSYADMDQDHLGIIYQATNWVYTGDVEVDECGKLVVDGVAMHPRSVYARYGHRGIAWIREHVDPKAEQVNSNGKHKYLMPMDRRMRRQIAPLAKPYPKGRREERG